MIHFGWLFIAAAIGWILCLLMTSAQREDEKNERINTILTKDPADHTWAEGEGTEQDEYWMRSPHWDPVQQEIDQAIQETDVMDLRDTLNKIHKEQNL